MAVSNKQTNTFLDVVKTTTSHISEFIGNTSDPAFTRGLMLSSPLIYKKGASFYFDYSSTANSADLKFLNKFFGSMTAGNTFAATGGTYYVESTGVQYNFAGTYQLVGKTGSYNQYLNLVGVTYSPSLVDGVYDSNNFTTTLNYTSLTGATCQCYISYVNKQDPFNINFLGIYGNDYGFEEYLQIPESTTNPARYKINTAIKLNDGSEIIYINNSTPISSENRFFNSSTVSIYMRGIPDLYTKSALTTLNGLLKKVNSEGTTLQIYDNQNARQKYCRSINDSENYYDWFPMHPGSNYENVFNPIAYDGLSLSIDFYSLLQIENIALYIPSVEEEQTQFPTTLGLIVDGVPATTVTYQVSGLSVNPVLKIDLSDSSLFSALIEPFSDPACSIPLSSAYFLNGVPGYDGASFIYLKNMNMPSVIYLKITKGISMVLQIVLQT